MKTYYLFGLPFADLSVNSKQVECIVDTGFNGALLLPLQIIKDLNLKPIAFAEYALANGNLAESEIYEANVDWLGEKTKTSILGIDTDFSLLGMQLLENAKTTLEPRKRSLSIEKIV